MSLADAEQMFWTLSDSEDSAIKKTLAQWMPWYVKKTGAAYEDGAELRATLESLGFKPNAELVLTHSEVVDLAIDASRDADVAAAASAFLLSASPDPARVRFQNPLRALSIIRKTPAHAASSGSQCDICGMSKKKNNWSPVNAAARIPRGYTGEDWELLDNTMVVRWFAQTHCPRVSSKDLTAFRSVLQIIADAPPSATSVQIAATLKKTLRGHIDPWRYFFETLGYSGVLKTSVQPGPLQAWTNAVDRRSASRSDVPTPCCHWRRSMGFDAGVFQSLFPKVKLPAAIRATEA